MLEDQYIMKTIFLNYNEDQNNLKVKKKLIHIYLNNCFKASHVHGTLHKHEWHIYIYIYIYIYVAEITHLNRFIHYFLHSITTVINRANFFSQICIVIHVYFDHFCDLQTSENTPGNFNARANVVCMFMCKNNVRIQSM